MALEYSKAAGLLRNHSVALVKVDGEKEAELAKEFMIAGYPSVILFRNGKKTDEYKGQRLAYGKF